MEELKVKLQNWKQAMEAKGLRVNMGKTKVIVSDKHLSQRKGNTPVLSATRAPVPVP